MKIRLLSDLHTEGKQGYKASKSNGEDVVVLAGDIAVGVNNTANILNQFQDNFPNVIYVPGNHEYYRQDFNDNFIQKLRALTKANVLDCDSIVKIQDVSFFGGTLWTNFGEDFAAEKHAELCINDFNIIKNFSTKIAKELYYKHSQFIKQAYETTKGKKVIVTHFLPARHCIAPQYRGPDLINNYFANSLDNWISTLENTTWFFGHTHEFIDTTIGDTRLVANPYGYYKNPNFKDYIYDTSMDPKPH